MNRLCSLCKRLRRDTGINAVVCKYGRGQYTISWTGASGTTSRSASSLRECEEILISLWR